MLLFWKWRIRLAWKILHTTEKSTLLSFVRMAIGVQLCSFSSVWRSQQDSLHRILPQHSTSCSSMVSQPLFAVSSSSAHGLVTLMNLQTPSPWWSSLNVATWWDTRKIWSLKKNVIGCCRRLFGSRSCTNSWVAQVWLARCIRTWITSTRSKRRSLRSLTISNAKVGMLLPWSTRLSRAIAKLMTISERSDQWSATHMRSTRWQYEINYKTYTLINNVE